MPSMLFKCYFVDSNYSRRAFHVLAINAPSVLATIYVISEATNDTVAVMKDQPAKFIPDPESFTDFQGYVVYADPPTACSSVKPPPVIPSSAPVRWILLARRYECDFQTKIENAQNASYFGIIVHNVGLNSTEAMWVKDSTGLNIFAIFIGEYDGKLLRENFTWDKGFSVRIQDDFSFNGYLLPFAIVVVLCFVVMLLFMLWQQVIRWVRERRRNRKRRLPASALKKLPTQKWTKGDPYETCAICIEDFVLHDKIRVLPCSHGFHTDCIDPWLTKGRRVCPICKRKVVLAEERFSESDSDSDSETAPLLGASTSQTQPPNSMGSTFVQQRENPFRRAQRRMRTRPQQRSVVIPDSESSSDDDYASSSDPSNVSSGSHKSIVAEVHLSQNHASGPHPCQVNIDGALILTDQLASSVASSAIAADLEGSTITQGDGGGASVLIQSQLPSSSSNGVSQPTDNETHNINDNSGPMVVKVNPSDSQELPAVTPDFSTSFSADMSTTDNPTINSSFNNAIM
ncbi:unnamed protein product [Allacma fusca]|uniref:RING-type domain-containing protein n=1 Tax=Allacma fusca TaxID=39272 RepID=A0A8J2P2Q3_9HEXA|nr:unnamed protein product [Allacma fusca]